MSIEYDMSKFPHSRGVQCRVLLDRGGVIVRMRCIWELYRAGFAVVRLAVQSNLRTVSRCFRFGAQCDTIAHYGRRSSGVGGDHIPAIIYIL